MCTKRQCTTCVVITLTIGCLFLTLGIIGFSIGFIKTITMQPSIDKSSSSLYSMKALLMHYINKYAILIMCGGIALIILSMFLAILPGYICHKFCISKRCEKGDDIEKTLLCHQIDANDFNGNNIENTATSDLKECRLNSQLAAALQNSVEINTDTNNFNNSSIQDNSTCCSNFSNKPLPMITEETNGFVNNELNNSNLPLHCLGDLSSKPGNNNAAPILNLINEQSNKINDSNIYNMNSQIQDSSHCHVEIQENLVKELQNSMPAVDVAQFNSIQTHDVNNDGIVVISTEVTQQDNFVSQPHSDMTENLSILCERHDEITMTQPHADKTESTIMSCEKHNEIVTPQHYLDSCDNSVISKAIDNIIVDQSILTSFSPEENIAENHCVTNNYNGVENVDDISIPSENNSVYDNHQD